MFYPQYPDNKDSEVKWLREIPAQWLVKRLKFSSALINDKVSVEESNLPYIGLEHIEPWTGKRIEGVIEHSEGLASRFFQNDVLFGKLRPYLAKVHLAKQDGLISSESLVIRANSEICPKFLKYYMLSRDFINIVDSSTYGSKMPRANWNFVGNLPVLIPEKVDQEVIARFLDFKTEQIDALIGKKGALLENLAEKRSALINFAVTKGLDGSAQKSNSGIPWLGQIPTHWSVKKLKYVTKSMQTGPFGSQLHADEYIEGGIPVINPTDISNGHIFPNPKNTVDEEIAQRLDRHKLELGDIVIGRRGEMGRAGVVRENNIGWLCGTGSLRARLDQTILMPEFVLFQFSLKGVADYLTLQSVGSTMDNLNTSILGRLPMVIPPIGEQKEVLRHLNVVCKALDLQVVMVERAVTSLTEYRSALITNAVTGKIDVRDVPIPSNEDLTAVELEA